MEIHERIRYAIWQSGKQKNEIARICHVTPAAVTHWTTGPTAIRDNNLYSLAKATGFRVEWLSSGTGPQKDMPISEQEDVIGVVAACSDPSTKETCYAEFDLEASGGLMEVVEAPDKKLRFSREVLKAAGIEPSRAAIAKITCRSMEKLILEGAPIAFDLSFKRVVDGEIYAFDQAGMLRVKYLYKLPGGGIRFRSENSTEYPDEFLSCEEFTHITILGRVFWWSTLRPSPRR